MIGREKTVLPQSQNIVGTAIHENGIKGARAQKLGLKTTYLKI